jgi:hypothetical protein
MAGWKFIAEFKRGRKSPIALEYFVAIPDLGQPQIVAAAKLVGARRDNDRAALQQ